MVSQRIQGFDTLRAVAALTVVIGHIALLSYPGSGTTDTTFQTPYGHIAVVLFFVLSGFLITYLLLQEKETHGSIHIYKFYLRRIFRIWPVYYLVLLSSYLLFDANYPGITIGLCLGIFPNIAHALDQQWPTSPQIWSIGVEEQFYLVWPWIITYCSRRNLLRVSVAFVILYTLLPNIITFFQTYAVPDAARGNFFNRFFYSDKFNCMSLGGIMAYLHMYHMSFVQRTLSKRLIILVMCIAGVLWYGGFYLPAFNDEFFATLFGIAILGIATHGKLGAKLETKPLVFLGRISYGIYMYHWIIILLMLQWMRNSDLPVSVFLPVMFGAGVGLTILVSWLSFQTMERFSLRLGKRFGSVETTNRERR
ncbi:MAG: acyltransferase [Flavobacteriales bacterium]|nr:acyltransferase [Flavobacteriales bacterium]